MPLIASKKQVSAELQSVVDLIPPTLGNASTSDTLVEEVEVTYDIERFERTFVRNSITSLKDVVGQKAVGIAFTFELLGDGTPFAAAPPRWSKFLEACGMKTVVIQRIGITAVTGGPFRHNETIVQAVSGAVGRVVGDVHNGTTEILIDKASIVAAFDATNIITGDDTGATATADAVNTDEGHAWIPITDVIKQIDTLADLTPALAIGNVIEGQTSFARGRVSKASVTGDFEVEYIPLRGTFQDGEVLNNLTTAAATIATTATPVREVYLQGHPIALRIFEDGIATTALGARGTPTFTFEVNRPVRCRVEFRGVLNATADIANILGINYDFTTPPLWVAANIGYANNELVADVDLSDEQAPCFGTLELALGAELADRKCADASGGLVETWITVRNGTGSGNPEATPEADLGFLRDLQNGQVFRLRVTVGVVDGQLFEFQIPGGQHTGDDPADEDGRMTRDFAFDLTGGNITNLNGAGTSINSIGGNNELILIYHSGP